MVDLESEDLVRLHDLVRAYARELAFLEDHEQHRKTAGQRLVTWYIAKLRATQLHRARSRLTTPAESVEPPAFDDDAAAQSWLDIEQANLGPIAALAQDCTPSIMIHQLVNSLEELGLTHLVGNDVPAAQKMAKDEVPWHTGCVQRRCG